jgi:hypothetical protein
MHAEIETERLCYSKLEKIDLPTITIKYHLPDSETCRKISTKLKT